MYPDSYLVEKIVGRKGNRVKLRYFGMDSSYDTWEPIDSVSPELLRSYTNPKKVNQQKKPRQ